MAVFSPAFFRLSSLLLVGLLGACHFPGRNAAPQFTQVTNPCIVVALPASGPHAGVSAKIKKGVELGRQTLRQSGIDARVENIDTSDANWLAKLDALPAQCAVVGGPLQEKNYIKARNAGQMKRRVFFSFLPILGNGEEGAIAWRFFPGQQDQIDALVNFAADELKVRTFGAFYPNDKYGSKMTAILEQELAKRNMTLVKAPYNPSAPATWAASLKPLLHSTTAAGSTPIPQTSFEVLFLPDSWKNMDAIVNALRKNGEDRLVLAGPTLWEAALSGKTVPNAERFALAVFPASWSHTRVPAPLKGQGNDFWTCLGYDFIKFAGHMGLAQKPDSATITTSIARNAAKTISALAPISWDERGVAHQKMHLFQVKAGGMAPLDVSNFKQTRLAVSERAALRMQGWGHIDPETGEALPKVRQAAPLSEDIQAQPVSTSPVPTQPFPASPIPDVPVSGRPVSPQPVSASPVSAQPAARTPAPIPVTPQKLQKVPGVMLSGPRSSYKLSLPNQP